MIIWDGSFYISRALSVVGKASPVLKDGKDISAVLLALNMFSNDLKNYGANQGSLVFVFDHPGVNFRHQLSKAYKRNHAADELVTGKQYQTRLTAYLLKVAGYNVLLQQGVEADDVITAVAHHSEEDVLICTGDKDLQQLVSDKPKRVSTLDTRQKPAWRGTEATVLDRYGIPPSLMPDYLALCGDKNDGVSGVKGIGDVKAKALLKEHGSAKGIAKAGVLNNTDLADLKLSYKLVKLRPLFKPKLLPVGGVPVVGPSAIEHLRRFFEGVAIPDAIQRVIKASELNDYSLFEDTSAIDDTRTFEDWEQVMNTLFDNSGGTDPSELWDEPEVPTTKSLFD